MNRDSSTRRRHRAASALAPWLLLAGACAVSAQTVYKSHDKDGAVTFSDQPPADAVQVETIDNLPAATDSQATGADEIERVKALGDELERDRKARAAKRQAEAAAQAAAAAKPPPAEPERERYGYRRPITRPPVTRPPVTRPPIGRPVEAVPLPSGGHGVGGGGGGLGAGGGGNSGGGGGGGFGGG